MSLTACGRDKANGGSSVLTWQEQYDLSVKYLSHGKYEEAIITFTSAIEVDPKQPDAYIGLKPRCMPAPPWN
ncbi:tetratricopeptide repeat protein [Dysosmobacter sp.]|uniref:tetratricopeptide repeat protein n=1 Tax=Dysosmobacter sp. TaxID=2591382 RepID=UPI003FA4C93D